MVAILKYNAGNIQSVLYALHRLGVDAIVTNDHKEILSADKVIFPGVGHAASAMESLKQNGLDNIIKMLKQPVLGICVGMQLLCSSSEEGNIEGLGIVDLKVKRFVSDGMSGFKIPHMGWNSITKLSSPLLNGVRPGSYVYYVHSYYAETGADTIAETNYIHPFSAVVQHNNFYGVQFHTEKSASTGEQILKNFLQLI
ncbi:MAG: imidazole glycerol phosphate synthase subunit HisH [Ginsengibacter sp.]